MLDQAKISQLHHAISRLGSVAVAFSGGADSTLLLALGLKMLGPPFCMAAIASRSFGRRNTRSTLPDLERRLASVGVVSYNGFLLSLLVQDREIVLFPTGRAIIRGTTDEAEARTIYARYIGT